MSVEHVTNRCAHTTTNISAINTLTDEMPMNICDTIDTQIWYENQDRYGIDHSWISSIMYWCLQYTLLYRKKNVLKYKWNVNYSNRCCYSNRISVRCCNIRNFRFSNNFPFILFSFFLSIDKINKSKNEWTTNEKNQSCILIGSIESVDNNCCWYRRFRR